MNKIIIGLPCTNTVWAQNFEGGLFSLFSWGNFIPENLSPRTLTLMALFKYFEPAEAALTSSVVPASTVKAVNKEVNKELEKELEKGSKRGEYLQILLLGHVQQ